MSPFQIAGDMLKVHHLNQMVRTNGATNHRDGSYTGIKVLDFFTRIITLFVIAIFFQSTSNNRS